MDGPNMLALAIMLLEIKFGTPIESLRHEGDFGQDGQPNEATDFATANRWLKMQVDLGNLSCTFTDAITYCLKCYVDPLASFGNPDFSKAVGENVLEPLEREMQFMLYGPQI
jgi:hypothetical protein